MGTLLSYATSTKDEDRPTRFFYEEEVQLTIGVNSIQMKLRGESVEIPITIETHQWIHLAITWEGGELLTTLFTMGLRFWCVFFGSKIEQIFLLQYSKTS